MDSVMRKLIREEIGQSSSNENNIEQPRKKSKTEGRLSNLLKRINKKNDKQTDEEEKSKKVHVKWKRYCPINNTLKLVRADYGGGVRLIEMPYNMELTAGDLMDKAISLYFADKSCNKYLETIEECTFEIVSPKGDVISTKTKLWPYIHENGFIVSKSTFVLTSKSANYLLNFEDLQFEPACCQRCGSSQFLTAFGNCLRCDSTLYTPTTSKTESSSTITTPAVPEPPKLQSNINQDHNLLMNVITINDEDTPIHNRIGNQNVDAVPFSNNDSEDDNRNMDEPIELVDHNIFVRIHRGKVVNDMMALFKEKKIEPEDRIQFKWIDQRGDEEPGEGCGVTRDIYSSFWNEAADSLFIGEDERVPFVRHDMYTNEWEVIGKILLKGFIDIGYFPVALSKVFVIFCMNEEMEEGMLLESFMEYLSQDERNLIRNAINDDVDLANETIVSEEFADFCEQFNCRSLVRVANVKQVIFEMARQELIQKPHIIASSWKQQFTHLKRFETFSSIEKIQNFYLDLEPTTKKVISLFNHVEPKETMETSVLNFLKRFLRGLDQSKLKKIMKFMTGSDLVIVQKIDVSFTKPTSNFARRPVVHTCGPLLELPCTYTNFVELREEFSGILKLNDWEMDIV